MATITGMEAMEIPTLLEAGLAMEVMAAEAGEDSISTAEPRAVLREALLEAAREAELEQEAGEAEDQHAKEVEDLPNRLALTAPAKVHHPIFGSLTSRGFYALLAMHLWIHVPQIEDQIKLHFTRPQPGHKTT